MHQEHHINVTKTARYFTLGDIDSKVKQVWFVCHGYGQLASHFLRNFQALNNGHVLVVAPEALSRFYLETPDRRVGATWMTREDRLNEIEDYINFLDQLADHIFSKIERMDVKISVLGFSQGTATVCRWATRGKIKPNHLILWAGRMPPELDLAKLRPLFEEIELSVVVGKEDKYATPEIIAEEEARLKEYNIPYQFITFEGGHQMNADVLKQLAER